MSIKHVHEELSAFIDGEAKMPDAISRHIGACPECARHHLELMRLSAQVQALSASGTPAGAAFLREVLSRVAAEPARRPLVERWFRAPQFALAAAVLAIAGVTVYEAQLGRVPAPQEAQLARNIPPAHVAQNDVGSKVLVLNPDPAGAATSTAQLAAASDITGTGLEQKVELLMAQGADVSLLEGSLMEENSEIPNVDVDDVVNMLAAASLDDGSADQVYSDSGPALLDSYGKDGLDALQVYLQQYKQTNKGRTT